MLPEYPYDVNTRDIITELSTICQKNLRGNSKLRLLGLYQSYNHSINGRYHEARDLLLQFYTPNKENAATSENVAYNRALVQLGFCAFQQGEIKKAKTALDDLCTNGKVKEQLMQAIPKNSPDRDDKRQLLPYHLHLSIEKIESIYVICVMLLEVPYLLTASKGIREKKSINKMFLKLWQFYEKNSVYGSSENYRDLIYCAIHEIAKGDWQKCTGFIVQLKFWKRLENSEKLLTFVKHQIKVQAFKCFILSMKRSFHVLNFETLSQLFSIDILDVRKVIFKMIHLKEINARMDAQSGSMVFGDDSMNDLAKLSYKINKRLKGNTILNEKLFDFKLGGAKLKDFTSGHHPDSSRHHKSKKGAHKRLIFSGL